MAKCLFCKNNNVNSIPRTNAERAVTHLSPQHVGHRDKQVPGVSQATGSVTGPVSASWTASEEQNPRVSSRKSLFGRNGGAGDGKQDRTSLPTVAHLVQTQNAARLFFSSPLPPQLSQIASHQDLHPERSSETPCEGFSWSA